MADEDLSGLPPAPKPAIAMLVATMLVSGHDVVIQCPCARCRAVRPFTPTNKADGDEEVLTSPV